MCLVLFDTVQFSVLCVPVVLSNFVSLSHALALIRPKHCQVQPLHKMIAFLYILVWPVFGPSMESIQILAVIDTVNDVINMKVSIFGMFGLKTHIHSLKIGDLGIRSHNGEQYL